MSYQRPRPEPSEEEIRRRRQIAVGAVGGAFLLFVLAIVLAVSGSGGDGGPVTVPAETTTRTTSRRPPARRPPRLLFPAIPANAPGAHLAPNEPVPILVYNVINTPKADTTNSQDWVPPEEFGEQMSHLAAEGFHPVTLGQVWQAWRRRGRLPSKPIVISFDAGYHSVYANALPVMRQRGWAGTLFLQVNRTQEDFPVEEVKALAQAKWEIDSSGQTGANLTSLTDEELDTEVKGSREEIRRNVGGLAAFFAYPQGATDERVVSAVEAAGYLGAGLLEPGRAEKDEPYGLRRIEIENGDGQQGLADKLASAGVR